MKEYLVTLEWVMNADYQVPENLQSFSIEANSIGEATDHCIEKLSPIMLNEDDYNLEEGHDCMEIWFGDSDTGQDIKYVLRLI